MKNKGSNMFFYHNGYDELKDSSVAKSSIEMSRASFRGGGLKWHIKLSHQTSCLHGTWKILQ